MYVTTFLFEAWFLLPPRVHLGGCLDPQWGQVAINRLKRIVAHISMLLVYAIPKHK